MTSCDECEFKKFAMALGYWFDGFAKFVSIMKRHNDNIYSSEQLMLDKLTRDSHKINLYMLECQKRYAENEPEEVSDNDR
jgi:hypothetical protein